MFWRFVFTTGDAVVVNPKISSGIPIASINRYPQPGSRPEKYTSPATKGAVWLREAQRINIWREFSFWPCAEPLLETRCPTSISSTFYGYSARAVSVAYRAFKNQSVRLIINVCLPWLRAMSPAFRHPWKAKKAKNRPHQWRLPNMCPSISSRQLHSLLHTKPIQPQRCPLGYLHRSKDGHQNWHPTYPMILMHTFRWYFTSRG